MPQIPVETNDRMSLRIASEEKLLLMRAAALQHINLTEFDEWMELTERDSLYVLNLLDNPPAPNDKLMAAAFALPKQS
ncbi:type II toxin-antitoxin system TacA family antitoxin [Photorhabdus tasmaniensis]|uniref:type II toxin-antitoxin system TacA family antitoxin n=1 Tax=Photorhabdus tasmaniensis TaxID=1004159 RepID=UPI004041D418